MTMVDTGGRERKREGELELPPIGLLPKSLQWPGRGKGETRSQELQ